MNENNAEAILLEYRKTVRNLFDTGASDVIDNSSPRHAAILIEEMVRHANVSFRAFAGRMNPTVWNLNVMDALDEAIKRGVDVQLLVEAGFDRITVDMGVYKRIYAEIDEFFNPTPIFTIAAYK